MLAATATALAAGCTTQAEQSMADGDKPIRDATRAHYESIDNIELRSVESVTIEDDHTATAAVDISLNGEPQTVEALLTHSSDGWRLVDDSITV